MGSWPPWNISSHFHCLWQFPTTFPVFLYSAHRLIFKLLGKKPRASSQVPNAPWCLLMPHLKFINHKECKTQIIHCATIIIALPAPASLPISSASKKQNLTCPQLLVSRIPHPDSQWKDEQDLHRTISTFQSLKPLILEFPTEIQQAKMKNQFLLSKLRDNPLSAWHSVHTCSNGLSLEQNHLFINSTFPSVGEDCDLMSKVSYG